MCGTEVLCVVAAIIYQLRVCYNGAPMILLSGTSFRLGSASGGLEHVACLPLQVFDEGPGANREGGRWSPPCTGRWTDLFPS